MSEKTHMCKTCGKTTEMFGHLCDPVEADEAYVCDHCGQASTDPRHICKPKLHNINFVCIACGRVAELPSQLCNPMAPQGAIMLLCSSSIRSMNLNPAYY